MYKRTFWKDHVEGVQEGTDMNAANFNNIEVGAMEANALASLNAEYQRYANDIAKNSEVVQVYCEPVRGTEYIEIPQNAIRNNTNYLVFVESNEVLSGGESSILITDKQANGFTATVTGNGTVLARLYISGGMI